MLLGAQLPRGVRWSYAGVGITPAPVLSARRAVLITGGVILVGMLLVEHWGDTLRAWLSRPLGAHGCAKSAEMSVQISPAERTIVLDLMANRATGPLSYVQ
jgi:hypothetical protein